MSSEQFKRKLEGQRLPLHNKRPYYGDVRPGEEYVEPKLYQQPNYSHDTPHDSTDFRQWQEADIKAFLDERGGDYDDCTNFQQLVERAQETEINTGPARKPGTAAVAGAAQRDDSDGYDPDEVYDPMAAADESAISKSDVGHQAGGAAAATPTPLVAAAPAADPQTADGVDDQYDPLEAFMAEINQEVAANKPNKTRGEAEALACDEVADPAAEYMAVRAAQASTSAAAIAANVAAAGYDSDEEVYATARALQAQAEGEGAAMDDDDNPAAVKRTIDPLAAVDHSLIEYDDFAKDFYTEHPSIAAMTDQQVRDYRRELQIHVSGFDPPRPVKTFGQAGFDHLLLGAIKKAGYEQPTAIQAQALPAVLSGRDVLGLAKTGSGKTAAFVLPMLVHIMDQPELAKGAGPIGLVLAPTRELAEQIHKEARKFSKPYGLRAVAAFGGLSKFDQFKELKAGAEIAVATPGRMMDLIRMKACNTLRVTYLVLDEADRMFDMGFEQQVRSLLGVVRPDRQTLLFSATLPRKIESLVADALSNPVRISVGQLGAANQDVSQRVVLLKDDAAKLSWLKQQLPGFVDEGDVLLFVGQRAKVDQVTADLSAAGFKAASIHGDMDQFTRMKVLDAFKSGQHHLLVATDVAARGLDIKSIKTVINFDSAKDIDTHIHRVGRTGRAGDKEGVAITLLLEGSNRDAHFAGLLVNSLTLGGQDVPRDLYGLAMKDARFRKGSSRGKGGKRGQRKGPQVGGAGLGFGPKPQQQPVSGFSSSTSFPGPDSSSSVPMQGRGGGGSTAGSFVQLPGFAKSTDDYEHESSAAAATDVHHPPPQQQQQQLPPWAGMKFPPPPPLPPDDPPATAPPSAAHLSGQPPLPQDPPVTLPGPPPVPAAAATDVALAAAAAATSHHHHQQQQPPAEPEDDGTMASARKQLMQHAYTNRLKNAFVAGGIKGGDIGQSATIMAPKVPGSSSSSISISVPAGSSKPAFRPPVPVTQRPMYLTRPKETITRGPRGGAAGGRPFQPQQQTLAAGAAAAGGGGLQSAAAQQAIAAAQAIAARLAAQGAGLPVAAGTAAAVGPGSGSSQPSPYQQQYGMMHPYQQPGPVGNSQQQASPGLPVDQAVAAAEAFAARLAAQHQHHQQ